MKKKLLRLMVLVAVMVVAWHLFDLGRFLNLYYIQSRQVIWAQTLAEHPLQVGAIFFLVYVAVAALPVPGVVVLKVLAGSLFGLGWGTVIVSFASTLGAALAFLLARTIGHDFVQRRFAKQLKAINGGVEKEGGFYLFSLRLAPVFPFFLVNLLMALTPIQLWRYVWISMVGMLPATLVYVNAGTQMEKLEPTQGILSPGLIASFLLLGFLPLISK
ncbi:MAG TPA: TVP38/TMEM64 family protein, partial [Dongiaceae bacterium]|nr:TVP38/TMEM64 family protein [Dongiaceae bacterium]